MKSSNRGRCRRLGGTGLLVIVAGCASLPPGGRSPERAAPPARVLSVPTAAGEFGLRYRLLLPPGYPEKAPYPVLYFLHDYFADGRILWRQGVATELERRMSSGEMAPFVLVAPDGDRGYWSDRVDGSRSYERWVAGPLREEVERRYAVRSDRNGRAVAGISMGGLGAVKLALRRGDLFSSASALSGALLKLDPVSFASYPFWTRSQLTRIFGPMGDPRATHAENDIRNLIDDAQVPGGPKLLLRSGTEDKYDLDRLSAELAERARARGLATELVLEPGGHDWSYWRRSFLEVATWHARQFQAAS